MTLHTPRLDQIEGYAAPIHRALWERILTMGAPRLWAAMWLSGCLYVALLFLTVTGVRWAILPLIVWALGQGVLMGLTLFDPFWDEIAIKHLQRRYKAVYDAGSGTAMKRGVSILAICFLSIVLCLPKSLFSQGLPVYDNANFIQNVITAVQAIFMVANQLLELAGVEEFALDDEYGEMLDQLSEIVTEARGLSNDLASLQSQVTILFHLDNAPRGASAYSERMAEIRKVVFECYVTALRTQTLIKTLQSAVRHMKKLAAAIGDLVGNMQGNQTLIQVEETISGTLAKLQAQSAAYERAQSVERLTDNLTMESLRRINEAVMADHPE